MNNQGNMESLEMEVFTLEEFWSAIRSQNVPREDVTFQCPICGELQSANDLIKAGAGETMEDVEGFLGFSCIGRFDSSKGCDWTLAGLFKLHNLVVVDPDGDKHPRFRPVPTD